MTWSQSQRGLDLRCRGRDLIHIKVVEAFHLIRESFLFLAEASPYRQTYAIRYALLVGCVNRSGGDGYIQVFWIVTTSRTGPCPSLFFRKMILIFVPFSSFSRRI